MVMLPLPAPVPTSTPEGSLACGDPNPNSAESPMVVAANDLCVAQWLGGPPSALEKLFDNKEFEHMTKVEKEMREEITSSVRRKIRYFIGARVPTLPGPPALGEPLRVLDQVTGLRASPVDFTRPEGHPMNVALLKLVVEEVYRELEDPRSCPQVLLDCGHTVSHGFLYRIAQSCFRCLQALYAFQRDRKAIKDEQRTLQDAQVRKRRLQKSNLRRASVPRYIELHGIDPDDLLKEEDMSDEFSGPEDSSGKDARHQESFNEWKARLIQQGKIQGRFEDICVREVVIPAGRDPKVTQTLHALSSFSPAASTLEDAKTSVHYVYTSSRSPGLAVTAGVSLLCSD